METLQNLGRMLVAALLVLMVVLPTAAIAGEPDQAPLSELPREYVPALRAIAEGLGLSFDELTSASEDELTTLLCDTLDHMSTDEVVARARAALDETPGELAQLSDAERAQLMRNLPSIVGQVESEQCHGGAGASGDNTSGAEVDETDDTGAASSDDASSDDDIPAPTHAHTGGGGAEGGGTVPAAFGALFAALFGLVGVGVTRQRPTG